MRVLSLFDGISCLRVALGDIKVDYYASEVDPNAIKISKKNYPSIHQIGDVRSVTGYTDIDLLCGGSPCVDLSIAKKNRKGLDGQHSKLFYEYLRVLDETKPKWFILENVASMPKKDRDEITQRLGVQPILIDAALVSAQSRKRLFWTNIPNVTAPADRGIVLKDILQSEVAEHYGLTKGNPYKLEHTTAPTKTEGILKVGHIGKSNGQANRVYDPSGKSVTLSANGGGQGAKTGLYLIRGVSVRGRKDASGNWANKVEVRKDDKVSALTSTVSSKLALVGRLVNRRLDEDGKRHDGDHAVAQTAVFEPRTDGKSGTLTHFTKDNMVLEHDTIRRLTEVECERLMGLPDNYTEGVCPSARYRCIGNAFHCEVMKHILSFLPCRHNSTLGKCAFLH